MPKFPLSNSKTKEIALALHYVSESAENTKIILKEKSFRSYFPIVAMTFDNIKNIDPFKHGTNNVSYFNDFEFGASSRAIRGN